MSGILVSSGSPTEAGHLHPRYDNENGILVVESKVERDWPYGIDVDGRIVFDIDEERSLANFDFHIPRDRWPRGTLSPQPPVVGRGDLVFSKDALVRKSFSLDIEVRWDPRQLLIKLGTSEIDLALESIDGFGK